MFDTVEGDLIELVKENEFDAIVHGCNCFHTMGAGIAKQIKKEFPDAYQSDLETEYGDFRKLGRVSCGVKERGDGTGFLIFNGYTQFKAGVGAYDPRVPVDYNAIGMVFRSLVNLNNKKLRIGFPMIGAGLAGGNWDIISNIINKQIDSKDNIHDWTLVKFTNHWTPLDE